MVLFHLPFWRKLSAIFVNMTKESTEKTAAAKLQLLKSPLIPAENHQPFGLPTVSPGPDLNLFGDRFGSHQDCPEFQKVRGGIERDYHVCSFSPADHHISTRMPVFWSSSSTCSSQPTIPSFRKLRVSTVTNDSRHMSDISGTSSHYNFYLVLQGINAHAE